MMELMQFESGLKHPEPSDFISKFCFETRKLVVTNSIYLTPSEVYKENNEQKTEFSNSVRLNSSSDLYLRGFCFYGTKKFCCSDLEILEEENVIVYQKEMLLEILESDYVNVFLNQPVLIRKNLNYEIKFRYKCETFKFYYTFKRGEACALQYRRRFCDEAIIINYVHPSRYRFNVYYLHIY